jgi:hypothetical protein
MGPQTENLQPLGMLPVYGKTDHTPDVITSGFFGIELAS